MQVSFETNAYGESVKVTTYPNGSVTRELDAPASAPPLVQSRILRDWEFRNRFTQYQLIGIMRAAMAGDDGAALVWLRLSTASDGVDLDDAANVAGLQYVATTYPALSIDVGTILA